MKRDISLYPLSHEHHRGLVLARKVKRLVVEKQLIEDARQLIIQDWENEIKEHFLDEEKFLEPICITKKMSSTILDRFHNDHRDIRNYIQEIISGTTSLTIFTQFSDQLRNHIKFEENEWFEEIQKVCTREELDTMGAELIQRRKKN